MRMRDQLPRRLPPAHYAGPCSTFLPPWVAKPGVHQTRAGPGLHRPLWSLTTGSVGREVASAMICLRGVALDAGKHSVRFVFRPTSFVAGASVSILCLVLILAWVGWRGYRGWCA